MPAWFLGHGHDGAIIAKAAGNIGSLLASNRQNASTGDHVGRSQVTSIHSNSRKRQGALKSDTVKLDLKFLRCTASTVDFR